VGRAAKPFHRAITVGAIVRHYLETSLSILHDRVWMRRKKKKKKKREKEKFPARVFLAAHFAIFATGEWRGLAYA